MRSVRARVFGLVLSSAYLAVSGPCAMAQSSNVWSLQAPAMTGSSGQFPDPATSGAYGYGGGAQNYATPGGYQYAAPAKMVLPSGGASIWNVPKTPTQTLIGQSTATQGTVTTTQAPLSPAMQRIAAQAEAERDRRLQATQSDANAHASGVEARAQQLRQEQSSEVARMTNARVYVGNHTWAPMYTQAQIEKMRQDYDEAIDRNYRERDRNVSAMRDAAKATDQQLKDSVDGLESQLTGSKLKGSSTLRTDGTNLYVRNYAVNPNPPQQPAALPDELMAGQDRLVLSRHGKNGPTASSVQPMAAGQDALNLKDKQGGEKLDVKGRLLPMATR